MLYAGIVIGALVRERLDLGAPNGSMGPNEWGDFLAGVFAPLAFLWLVIGYYRQGDEIAKSTQQLERQADAAEKVLRQSIEPLLIHKRAMGINHRLQRHAVCITNQGGVAKGLRGLIPPEEGLLITILPKGDLPRNVDVELYVSAVDGAELPNLPIRFTLIYSDAADNEYWAVCELQRQHLFRVISIQKIGSRLPNGSLS